MNRLRSAALTAAVLLAAWPAAAAVSVIPKPCEVQEFPGTAPFRLYDNAAIVADPAFAGEAVLASEELGASTGYALPVTEGGRPKPGDIVFVRDAGQPKEGYCLTVTEDNVRIAAADGAGAFYGYQTLRQLLPPEIYADSPVRNVEWKAPCVVIRDRPRLAWRGTHLDDARHFLGPEAFRAQIDAMAAYKMNVLHWHITDDQGWRIEIKKYPEIAEQGSVRPCSARRGDRGNPDGTPYGPYFYTQEQIRELVAYAARRHITVVPEIDMPGHMRALLASHPELSCRGERRPPRWQWGVDEDIICAGNDAAIAMMKAILDEITALFPSEFIHIGGDEAPKTRWNACPKCQARIRAEGLRDAHHLQSWFIGTMARHLESRGRKAIGWDEILEGGLPQGTAVMSWRGSSGGVAAAKLGHQVVMSPNSHCYFDYGQGIADDPYEYLGANITLERAYALNPTDGIPGEMQHYVIGVQGNLWSEYIWDLRDLQWKAWPRCTAVAEIGWTPQAQRGWADFRRRTLDNYARFRAMGVNAAPLPAEPVGRWSSGEIPTEYVTRTWDVTETVTAPGIYRVTFAFTGGYARLDIRSAAFVAGGRVLCEDRHDGRTGGTHLANTYQLLLRELPAGAKVTLSAVVRTDGSDDSNGTVTVTRVP